MSSYFVHVRGEVDFEAGEDPGPDLEFDDAAQAFASLERDTLRCCLSSFGGGKSMPYSLAEMLWDRSGCIEGGVVRSPGGGESMLAWSSVMDGDLLGMREEARKILVEAAVRKDGRDRTPAEFFDLYRLLRPGDVVSYDGPVALSKLVRVGDDVLGKGIRKLGMQVKPDHHHHLVMTHMFTCVIAGIDGEETKMCVSLYQTQLDVTT